MSPRSAELCRARLAALEATEGRRKQRKRDQTPDAIGLAITRDAPRGDCARGSRPGRVRGRLLDRCLTAGTGPVRAMAMEILAEWRPVDASRDFRAWLADSAPSDDRA